MKNIDLNKQIEKMKKAFPEYSQEEVEETARVLCALAEGFDELDRLDNGRRKLNEQNYQKYLRCIELMKMLAEEGYGKYIPRELNPKEYVGHINIQVNILHLFGKSLDAFRELLSLVNVIGFTPLADGETIVIAVNVLDVYEQDFTDEF